MTTLVKTTSKIKRGNYGEILLSSISSDQTKKQINNLIEGAKNAQKVDEHGGWEFGAAFDRKGRGSALNYDLYAYGKDIHSKRFMIVLQIRQFTSGKRWNTVHKSYFLIGRNEDNTIFAHCVEARVIHAAIRNDKDVIKAVQDWIFQADYSKVIRQGDISLIPMKKKLTETNSMTEIVLEGSHKLIAEKFQDNGSLYVQNPSIYHLPKTHPDFEALKGVYKVVVGKRAAFWNFAKPTID